MGVIVAMNQLDADAFSEDDLRLAETFAARVAVAVRLAARGGQESTHEDHSEAKRAGLTAREVEVLRLVATGRVTRRLRKGSLSACAPSTRTYDPSTASSR